MRLARALLFLIAATALAEKPGPEPARNFRSITPSSPETGKPFDDREVLAYFEKESRKLYAAGRVKPIKSAPRRCARPFPGPPAANAATSARPTIVEIASRAEAATVILGEFYKEPKHKHAAFGTSAGAFFIGEKGVLLTSLHAVSDKQSEGFVAMTRDGKVFPVREALALDPVDDLIVLQLDVPEDATFPALHLAPEAAPTGSTVSVMSHPDEHFWFLSSGHVARHTLWRGPMGDEHYTCITADFAKGSSGCPVLDDKGSVVAIVNNTQSVYYEEDERKKQLDLQMVIKNSTPAWVVRTLFE